jgi:hypothetical protein
MTTVPTPQLSQPVLATWTVRRNRFPFGIGEVLGTVQAYDRETALVFAWAQFGAAVVVERSLRIADTPEKRNG